ncbi:hypothetical protein AVEN_30092-1 [Araneus ventricosus]|uniref:Uncharacterized protein n=1 Tax=Araneus ventricosus TaxID=182803 RepID=A0A4Y2TPA2_ARAVE|nr:hypothetical protein AVEN_174488-1 [Araneus ventricosus]GBO02011.1 hypothetical protein AVEN_30092-1 [Araneus ventricosus]
MPDLAHRMNYPVIIQWQAFLLKDGGSGELHLDPTFGTNKCTNQGDASIRLFLFLAIRESGKSAPGFCSFFSEESECSKGRGEWGEDHKKEM